MRLLRNERGIALVMVLVLSLIGLMIVSALLYLATSGSMTSGAFKAYRTAEEASYGGAEIAAEYAANRGRYDFVTAVDQACNCADPLNPADNIDGETGAASCRCDKICNATVDWGVACDENAGVAGIQINLTPDDATDDFPLTLGNFVVYTKIVDTVVGNSDMGGIVASGELGGQGVVASSTGLVSPPSRPYLYRMEIDARSTINPREHSRISMLYAY